MLDPLTNEKYELFEVDEVELNRLLRMKSKFPEDEEIHPPKIETRKIEKHDRGGFGKEMCSKLKEVRDNGFIKNNEQGYNSGHCKYYGYIEHDPDDDSKPEDSGPATKRWRLTQKGLDYIDVYENYQGSVSMRSIVQFLKRNDWVTRSNIQDGCSLAKYTVGVAVRKMISQGLVEVKTQYRFTKKDSEQKSIVQTVRWKGVEDVHKE